LGDVKPKGKSGKQGKQGGLDIRRKSKFGKRERVERIRKSGCVVGFLLGQEVKAREKKATIPLHIGKLAVRQHLKGEM